MFQRTIRFLARIAIVCGAGLALISPANGQSKRPPITPPHVVKLVKPDCGTGQSCNGIHGMVVVTVDVLTDGTVGDTTIKTGDPRLTDVAVKAAKQCRFEPGTFNGKPTSMNFDIKYQF